MVTSMNSTNALLGTEAISVVRDEIAIAPTIADAAPMKTRNLPGVKVSATQEDEAPTEPH
jgi:hypothetical protein